MDLDGQTEASKCRAWSILRGKPAGEEGVVSGEVQEVEVMVWGEEVGTVDEEFPFPVVLLDVFRHGVFKQLHRHFHRHDLPVPDILLDHVPELAVRSVLLRPQQIPRRQVREAVVAHDLLALGPLARAGAAQDEDNGDIVRGEGRRVFGGRGDLRVRFRGGDGRHGGFLGAGWVRGLRRGRWCFLLVWVSRRRASGPSMCRSLFRRG